MFNFSQSNPIFDSFLDWIESLFQHQAVLAPLLLLIIEEAGVPMPIPGDVIIAYTGYNVAQGKISYEAAYVTIMLSIFIGSTFLFFVSRRWGNIILLKFGKFLHLNPKRLTTVEEWFKKYGYLVVIIGRHIPGFRIPITFFAGISGMSYPTFIISTLVSTLFWAMFNLNLGMRLGSRVNTFFRTHAHAYLFIAVVLLSLFTLYILHSSGTLEHWRKKLLKDRLSS